MDQTPAIVTEPDDVDPMWLTAVLAGSGREVTALRHEPVGTGLMARSHRYVLEPEGDPASVVIKFPSSDVGTRTLGASAYAREIGFYRDLATTVEGHVPHCHHAAMSATGEDFVLVLEDMRPARPGDQLNGCDLDAARAAVVNLAHLHRSTWNDDRLSGLPWLQSSHQVSLGALMGMVHDAFVERFAGRLDDATWPVLARFAERIEAWLDREPDTRALMHGDYRLDNLLFGTDGSVTAVDWQTVDYRCPLRDLAYFLGNSLTVDDRRAHEDELVDCYLATIGDVGVEPGPADDVAAKLRHGMFHGPLVTMLGAFTAGRSDRSEDMFTVMADRSAAQILDHGALDVLD